MDEFCQLVCGPDLLQLKIFPNAKEITESMAAFSAVRAHLWQWFRPSDPSVNLIAVGDGVLPRTASLFAYRSAWQCHSIDPRLTARELPVNRLSLWRRKIEECSFTGLQQAVIVAVHSHANLEAAIAAVQAQRIGVVAIPCCVPQTLSRVEIEVYEDVGIWSPQRMVHIWQWNNLLRNGREAHQGSGLA